MTRWITHDTMTEQERAVIDRRNEHDRARIVEAMRDWEENVAPRMRETLRGDWKTRDATYTECVVVPK